MVQDWVEAGATAFGLLALLLSMFCAFATVFVLLHLGDEDSRFGAGRALSTVRVLGIALLAAAAVGSFGIGRGLVGRRLVRGLRALRAGAGTEEGPERAWTISVAAVLLAGAVVIGVAVFRPETGPGSSPEGRAPASGGVGEAPSAGVLTGDRTCRQCR
jgi:hypothetical protein